jgi:formiminoglutamate deiminase
MYELAARLTPETIYDISLVAYRELAAMGVRTVGEFHYLHHAPGGAPYDDRVTMAEAVIRAARDAGIRIALLRVVYARAAKGRPPEGAQRRFSDERLDDAFSDVEALSARHAGAADVRIGIAPHSVRAVPPEWLPLIASFARVRQMPVHMHVAEQPAEIAACLDETRRRPVELLSESGVLDERFVAVHATHISPHEAVLLGAARAFVCLCPTTERDLGDGLPDLGALRAAAVRLCTGIDSHVMTQPLEDLRAVDLGERLRTGRRVTVRSDRGFTPAEELWDMGSRSGAEACGFPDPGGFISISRSARELTLVPEDRLLDAIVYSGGPGMVTSSGTAPIQ